MGNFAYTSRYLADRTDRALENLLIARKGDLRNALKNAVFFGHEIVWDGSGRIERAATAIDRIIGEIEKRKER